MKEILNIALGMSIVTIIVLGPHFLHKYLIAKREARRDKKKNDWWNELEKKETLNKLLEVDINDWASGRQHG